jgi:hypothetical protein
MLYNVTNTWLPKLLFKTFNFRNNSSVSSNSFIAGKLLAINNDKSLGIIVKHPKLLTANSSTIFQLDIGASYSQINTKMAKQIGLKGHPKIVGFSQIADGSMKFDYLCEMEMIILDIPLTIVASVSPNNHNLLGLDVMSKLSMKLNIEDLTYQISKSPKISSVWFQTLDFDKIIQQSKIKRSELKPVDSLPNPQIAYQQLLNNGDAKSVINLGTTFSGVILPKKNRIPIDLGTSFLNK